MAKFNIYEDVKGEYRWRLVADNGRVMADSAEGYVTEAGAEDALNRFIELAPTAKIVVESEE